MITKKHLGIMWKDRILGETLNVPGIILFAYSKKEWVLTELQLKNIDLIWKKYGADIEQKLIKWAGEENCDYSIDIHIKKWPSTDKWLACLEKTLSYIVSVGAEIVWCSDEMGSPSMDQITYDGDIYAAYMKHLGLFVNSNLEDEFKNLNSTQLESLKVELTQ